MVRRYTTDEWVAKAISVHGDRYDYSRVDYKGADVEVAIGCEIHGWFNQLPRVHANQGGHCQSCMEIQRRIKRTLTTAQFISRAREVEAHRGKYDYSLSVYKKAKERLAIFCKICDTPFLQTPDAHLSGKGCSTCGKKHSPDRDYSYLEGPRLSQDDFIMRCKARWGDRIDYSETVFEGTQKMISVRCIACDNTYPIFANNHLRGNYGCQICRYERAGDSARKTTVDYILEAKSIHGSDFDYSEVEYNGRYEPVIITCNTCQTRFAPLAKVHLTGEGSCPGCRYVKMAESRRIPMQEVLEKCVETHGNRYEYPWNESDYISTTHKMPIACKEHGIFEMTPMHHYDRGQGCSKCSKKTQTKLYDHLVSIFPDKSIEFDFKHPDLRFSKTNRAMELDIWIPELKLAFEYQGEWHFVEHWSVSSGSTRGSLTDTHFRDEEKRVACRENGITLIEVDFTWDRERDSVVKKLEEEAPEILV